MGSTRRSEALACADLQGKRKQKQRGMLAERVEFNNNGCRLHIAGDGATEIRGGYCICAAE